MRTKMYAMTIATCLMWVPQLLQAQPGALDPTFNGTGYVVTPVNQGDGVQKILVQDDQKILEIGMSWDGSFVASAYVFRYLPDGSPDLSFGTNGSFVYSLDFEALFYSAVITDEGKILLVGSTTDYQTYRMLLVQLNADGTLDTDFGNAGVVLQHVSLVVANAEDMAYDVTLDAQGNILVCGSSFDENSVRRPVVVRFTPDGSLDTSFGVDGVATIPVLTVGSSSFQGVLVQPDGKIVASGYFGNSELWYVMLLVRFEADGTLDPTFGDAGVVKHNFNNIDDEGEDLVLTPDGSFLIAGVSVTQNYNYNALLTKFTPNGELDMTFGTNGAVVEDLDDFDFASNVRLLADGRIVIAGSSGDGPPAGFDLAVWKYQPDGTPDNSFGNNGLAQHMVNGYYTMIYGLDVQADGKILIGGQARTTMNQNYFFVARLENDVTSAIDELSGSVATNTFPNPATAGSVVTVRGSEAIGQYAQVDLLAMDGRLVATYPLQFQRTEQGITITLPMEINAGVYQLNIVQPDLRLTSTVVIAE